MKTFQGNLDIFYFEIAIHLLLCVCICIWQKAQQHPGTATCLLMLPHAALFICNPCERWSVWLKKDPQESWTGPMMYIITIALRVNQRQNTSGTFVAAYLESVSRSLSKILHRLWNMTDNLAVHLISLGLQKEIHLFIEWAERRADGQTASTLPESFLLAAVLYWS